METTCQFDIRVFENNSYISAQRGNSMDIPINARITCLEGPCGHSELVIIKPTTQEITHLVISNDSSPETEYLVLVDRIAESTPDQIQLNCSREELSKMQVFAKEEFIPTGGAYMLWPYYYPLSAAYVTVEEEYIPADELAIRRGARVEAGDGYVGHVHEFLINPGNDQIAHLVMREGYFWGQKDVTIPVSQIDHYQDNTVYLKMNKRAIEKLPAIPVRRSWAKID
jgi:sporulation protein YlmC with PRC-barrel domain